MADFGNAGAGAISGAGLGSMFGPVGTAVGGLAGGVLGLFGGGKGKKPKIQQMQNYNPQQQAYLNDLLQKAQAGNQEAYKYLMSILSDDEEAYADFERPAMEQFQEQTIPSILERLNAGGGMNKNSGAVTQQLAQAGRGLSGDLAAQRAKLKQSALEQLNRYGEIGLQKQTTPYIKGGEPSAWQGLQGASQEGFKNISSAEYKNELRNLMNRFRGGI